MRAGKLVPAFWEDGSELTQADLDEALREFAREAWPLGQMALRMVVGQRKQAYKSNVLHFLSGANYCCCQRKDDDTAAFFQGLMRERWVSEMCRTAKRSLSLFHLGMLG